jgi:hypothetical protein
MTTYSYFDNFSTPDEIRARYRQLAQLHHPDHGGSTATMQAINAEYALAIAQARRANKPGKTETEYASMAQVDEHIRAAIEAIITYPGLDIEICGLWVWVGGNTKTYKDQLKTAGYKWAPKKIKWYFAGVPAGGRGQFDMDDIRERYGSEHVTSKPFSAVA